MHETYITFDQAVSLKSLGFPQSYLDLPSSVYWLTPGGSTYYPKYTNMEGYAIVPLSLVQKWFREEHNIELYCIPCMYDSEMQSYEFEIIGHRFARLPYDSYESALSAGINKCIEILKSNVRS